MHNSTLGSYQNIYADNLCVKQVKVVETFDKVNNRSNMNMCYYTYKASSRMPQFNAEK